MYTNYDYNRFYAQSKMRQFQQQSSIHRQLKQVEEPNKAPLTISQIHQMFLALKSMLVRPIYILKPE